MNFLLFNTLYSFGRILQNFNKYQCCKCKISLQILSGPTSHNAAHITEKKSFVFIYNAFIIVNSSLSIIVVS